MNKMSLEEFRRIKNHLLEILNMDGTNISKEDEEKYVKELFDLMKEITEHDLSDIPFEEWKGMILFSEDRLDMSKTHANIDFALLQETGFESIDLRGCNVRNLGSISYNEDSFDQEFKDSHPEFFPSKDLPEEIREKFYDGKLTLEDLINYPSLRQCANLNSFDGISRSIVNLIGIEYTLRMLDEYTDLMLKIITKNPNSFLLDFRFDTNIKFEGGSYEEAKDAIFKNIIYNVELSDYEIMGTDLIPEEMKKKHPEVFFNEEGLPEEVLKNYTEGRLNLYQIKEYLDILKDKNIKVGIRCNYGLRNLIELYGSLDNILSNLPEELYGVMTYYINEKWWNNKDEIKDMFDNNIEQLYRTAIFAYMDRNNNYFLANIKDFSKYVPLNNLITDDKVVEIINYFGIDTIIEFSDKYNYIFEKDTNDYFSTDYSNTFLGIIAKQDKVLYGELPRNIVGLEQFVRNIIDYTRDYNHMRDELTGLVSHYGKSLSKIAPDKYIDYEAFTSILKDESSYYRSSLEEKLNKVLMGSFDSLLELIKEYPKFLVLLDGRNIIFNDIPMLNDIVNIIGIDKFIDICVKYREIIEFCKNNYNENSLDNLLAPIREGEEPERALNKYIYNTLTKNDSRICDIQKLPESFKKAYPDLFLADDPEVPDDLRREFVGMKFYGSYNKMSLSQIALHPEWIPFLEHLDLTRSIVPIRVSLIDSDRVDVGSYHYYGNHSDVINIFEFLKQYMSNREMLEFLSLYSFALDYNTVIGIPKNEIKDNNIKEVIKDAIYRRIIGRTTNLTEHVPDEFKDAYPDIFLAEDAPEELKTALYQRRLNYMLIREHPEWDRYLDGKKLNAILDRSIAMFTNNRSTDNYLTNRDYLYLIRKYGKYLTDDRTYSMKGTNLAEAEESLKGIITSMIRNGFEYGEDAIELIGDLCPEMFLDPAAPEELKNCFYHQNNMGLDFYNLKKNRDWLPYLDGKDFAVSMSKVGLRIYTLREFFKKAGDREGLLIGMKNPEAVSQMIIHNNVDLLLEWYNRIKFVPHYAVMTGFPVAEADKFMAVGKLWSQIMRIDGHNDSFEHVDSMIKAAYMFGIFDGDREGFSRFMQLFTDAPSRLSRDEFEEMDKAAERLYPFKDEEIAKAREVLKGAYYLGDDGSYHLQIDSQNQREESRLVRRLAEQAELKKVLSPLKAHQIFGGFILKYSPTFRDFFMANLDEILDPDNEYISYMNAIMKQWDSIRVVNSNRVLTLALAKDFVLTNKYMNVEVGNEQLAQSSGNAGYSQADFDKLQEIYSYGKERVHSSIPRIAGSVGRYNYELLRLDDAYATAIGTLTDCCQEIGDAAEVCMEHSMVSEHGRVFVIRDQNGNFEAQSWVWRNKNVLCFDNIEIPYKAFTRAAELNLSREEYADEILGIYKKAAEEIIAADEAMFKSLLEAGRITQEQYENLRIRKVTAGAGYNDIKESLIRNTQKDKGVLTGPLHFREPVKLSRSLYTHDSEEGQFILAGEEKVPKSDEETLPVYSDEFRIITKETMNDKYLKMMERIEFAGRNEDSGNLYVYSKDHILEAIANNYGLDPKTTEVVIHPNFFIVYCTRGDTVYIGDIVRNVRVNTNVQERDITDIVNLQIGLALKQIKGDRNFDTSLLEEPELGIFMQAILDEQKDSERGFTHGL